MPPKIDKDLCTMCGTCTDVCPEDILRLTEGKSEAVETVYPAECWNCGICKLDCPEQAIQIELPLAMRPVFVRVKN